MIAKSKILIVSIFFYSLNLNSFPHEFRRLVCLKNGTIVKTIDLISEIHEQIYERVKKPSARQRKYLTSEERKAMTIAERTLLTTFLEFAKGTKPTKTLLWEYGEPKHIAKADDPKAHLFIGYGAWAILEELKKPENKGLVFIDVDTYRPLETSAAFFQEKEVAYSPILLAPLKNVVDFYSQIMDPKTSIIDRDLEKLQKVNVSAYEKISLLWQDYRNEKELKNAIRALTKAYEDNPTMNIGDFVKGIFEGKYVSEEEKIFFLSQS